VLDLGCAPGAWLQVASEIVGSRGRVVGIDLQAVRHDFGGNVKAIQGDVYETDPAVLTDMVGGEFDCVISDMAPNTTGHGDHFLSVRLCERVREMLPGLLRPGGNLAMKVFEGEVYPELLRQTQRHFRLVRGFKPKASREVSSEMYVIAHGYRPPG
jgi:23S rRNA (uridine2552-2'-O)-methyltransferase